MLLRIFGGPAAGILPVVTGLFIICLILRATRYLPMLVLRHGAPFNCLEYMFTPARLICTCVAEYSRANLWLILRAASCVRGTFQCYFYMVSMFARGSDYIYQMLLSTKYRPVWVPRCEAVFSSLECTLIPVHLIGTFGVDYLLTGLWFILRAASCVRGALQCYFYMASMLHFGSCCIYQMRLDTKHTPVWAPRCEAVSYYFKYTSVLARSIGTFVVNYVVTGLWFIWGAASCVRGIPWRLVGLAPVLGAVSTESASLSYLRGAAWAGSRGIAWRLIPLLCLPSSRAAPMVDPAPLVDLTSISELRRLSVVVVLLIVSVQPLLFMGTDGKMAVGRVLPLRESRSTAVRLAEGIIRVWTGRPPEVDLIFVGETEVGMRVVAAPIQALAPDSAVAYNRKQRLALLAAGCTFGWLTYASLVDTPAMDIAILVAHTALSYVRPVRLQTTWARDDSVGTATFRFGGMELTGLAIRPPERDKGARFRDLRLDICRLASQALQRGLDVDGEDARALCLREWADRVQPAPHAEVPIGLLNSLPSFSGDWLADRPFAAPLPRVTAPFQKPLPLQLCAPPPAGATLRDMLMPLCVANLSRCEREYLRDLVDIQNAPWGRNRPKPCALAMECMRPEFRGCVWDMRSRGRIIPVNYHRPLRTHLNLDFYVKEMHGHPDQELLSHMLHGIRFQALTSEHDRQFVMLPHLLSIGNAFPAVQSELRRLSRVGRIELYASPPFWPVRCSPQGTTPRKYEVGRDRRTSECGAPRKELFDSEGRRVYSLNEQSARPREHEGVYYPIPKEHKPTLQRVMRDLCILLHLAYLSGELVYLFADDFADYFNQLTLAEEELWKSVVVTLAEPGDPGYRPEEPTLVYASELGLGFGSIRSSNYAQRHSNLLAEVVFRRALPGNRQILAGSRRREVHQWLERRKQLGMRTGRVEDRGFTFWIYTDDQLAGCVGLDATVHLLGVWTDVVTEAGLWMAIAKKRQIGTCVVWLGILLFSTLGIAVVTADKLLRASNLVGETLAETILFADYMRLCGQLEHIRTVNGFKRLSLYGMYVPHAQQLGPTDRVSVNELMQKCLQEWALVLTRTGGAPFLVVFNSEWTGSDAAVIIFMSSDASKEGTATPGLGGFCNGMYWSYPLPPWLLTLFAISALELMAAVLCVHILWSRVRHFPSVAHQVDALATPFVLAKDAAKSYTMQTGARLALAKLPGYRAAAESGRYAIGWHAGDRNVPADLVSRGYWPRFFALMRVMRVRPSRLPIPDECITFVATWAASELRHQSELRGERDGQINVRLEALGKLMLHHASTVREDSSNRLVEKDLLLNTQIAMGHESPPRKRRRGVTQWRPASLIPLLLLMAGDVEPHPGPFADFALADGASFEMVARALDQQFVEHESSLRRAPLRAPDSPRLPQARLLADRPEPNARDNLRLLASRLAAQRASVRRPSAFSVQDAWSTAASGRTADSFAQLILKDESPFALRPIDSHSFKVHVQQVAALLHLGVRPGTRKADENAWAYHVAHCAFYNTPVLRTQRAFDENPRREAFRECSLMLTSAQLMKPRSKQDRDARPASALGIALSVRRVLGYDGIVPPPFKLTRLMLKGMSEAYLAIHGKESLKARRKEGMPDRVRDDIFAIPDGTRLSSLTFRRGTHNTDTLLDVISVLQDTGLRKAEIVEPLASLYLRCQSWGDVAWMMDGLIHTTLSDSVLQQVDGSLTLILIPTNSKCDATGEHWGNKPIPIPYEDAPHNAVVRIAARWLRLGIGRLTLQQKKEVPLFGDILGRAYTPSTLDRYHNDVLNFVDPVLAKVLSLHSYRIRLAARLRKAGAKDERVQAYVRWLNPASLHIYARWDLEEYAQWLRKSRKVSLTALEATNVPVIDVGVPLHALNDHLARRGKEASAPTRAPTSWEMHPSLCQAPPRFYPSKPEVALKRKQVTPAVLTISSSHLAAPLERANSKRPRTNVKSTLASPRHVCFPECPYDRCNRVSYPHLPDNASAIRKHARARCYWFFRHPFCGRNFESITALSRALAAAEYSTPRSSIGQTPTFSIRMHRVRRALGSKLSQYLSPWRLPTVRISLACALLRRSRTVEFKPKPSPLTSPVARLIPTAELVDISLKEPVTPSCDPPASPLPYLSPEVSDVATVLPALQAYLHDLQGSPRASRSRPQATPPAGCWQCQACLHWNLGGSYCSGSLAVGRGGQPRGLMCSTVRPAA